MTSPRTDAAPPAKRSSSIAAALSFLWPGLGQWYAGRPRAAALYAIPTLIVLLAILVRAAAGLSTLAIQLIEPSVALTVLVLVIVAGLWRMFAIADASASINRRLVFRGRAGGVLIGLLLAVLATHGVLAYYAYSFYENGSQIFVGDNPNPTDVPGSTPDPSNLYEATPFATPETADSRITILLTGIDKTTERTHSLTDTLLVLSVDPVSGDTDMVSFPRDTAEFPLYMGGTFKGKINSLFSYAGSHPTEFPDGPLPSLARELSFLLGIPINYYAAIDLDGFRLMIDRVGGITVTVDRAIQDSRYDWLDGSNLGFFLSKGTHTLDGRHALAYVRSRYGIGDNDFTRAARQQQLLLALRKKLTDPAMLPRLPAVLDVAGDTIRTNFPSERIDEMLELAQGIDEAKIQRFVLQPPVFSKHPPTNTTGGTYILRLNLNAVRALSVMLFGEDSDFWTGTFDPVGSPIPATVAPTP